MRRFVACLALTALAVAVGFAIAWAVLAAVIAILPPFRFPDDDDTLREYGPVILAYAAWALTSLTGSSLAWTWVRRRS